MKDEKYNTIESLPLSFTVTILESVVPVVSPKVYKTSTPPLIITYDEFRVLPSNYRTGLSHIEIFISAGSSIP